MDGEIGRVWICNSCTVLCYTLVLSLIRLLSARDLQWPCTNTSPNIHAIKIIVVKNVFYVFFLNFSIKRFFRSIYNNGTGFDRPSDQPYLVQPACWHNTGCRWSRFSVLKIVRSQIRHTWHCVQSDVLYNTHWHYLLQWCCRLVKGTWIYIAP